MPKQLSLSLRHAHVKHPNEEERQAKSHLCHLSAPFHSPKFTPPSAHTRCHAHSAHKLPNLALCTLHALAAWHVIVIVTVIGRALAAQLLALAQLIFNVGHAPQLVHLRRGRAGGMDGAVNLSLAVLVCK